MKVELEQSSEIKIKLEKLQKDYAMMERDKEKVHFFYRIRSEFSACTSPFKYKPFLYASSRLSRLHADCAAAKLGLKNEE